MPCEEGLAQDVCGVSCGAGTTSGPAGTIQEVLRDNALTGTKMGRDVIIDYNGHVFRLPAYRFRAYLNAEAECLERPYAPPKC